MTPPAATDLSLSLSSIDGAAAARLQAAMRGTAENATTNKAAAKAAARDFEAMFLNAMFQQMSTGITGDGPFGGSGPLKVWRSFLTDQYAKSFAKAGGIGIAAQVYQELLQHQGSGQ